MSLAHGQDSTSAKIVRQFDEKTIPKPWSATKKSEHSDATILFPKTPYFAIAKVRQTEMSRIEIEFPLRTKRQR